MDPRAVLGVEAGASMDEIRSRYRALVQLFHPDRVHGMPETVRQEAERRMKELTAAYSSLESQLKRSAAGTSPTAATHSKSDSRTPPPPPPPPRRAVNPSNRPLKGLKTPVRSLETDHFWLGLGIEPVMIRLGDRTGLTLATPLIPTDDEPTQFLVDDRCVHMSHSVEGLIELARQLGPWRQEARFITAQHVIVPTHHRYDLTQAIESIALSVEQWDLSQLIEVHNLAYDLANFLEIDVVVEAFAPGSGLHRMYQLIQRLNGGAISRWSAHGSLGRFDLVSVFDAWNDIESNLLQHMQWHF